MPREREVVGTLMLAVLSVFLLLLGPDVAKVVSNPECRAQDAGKARLCDHIMRKRAREDLKERAVVPCEADAAEARSLEQEELRSDAQGVSDRQVWTRDNMRAHQLVDLAPLLGVESLERDVRGRSQQLWKLRRCPVGVFVFFDTLQAHVLLLMQRSAVKVEQALALRVSRLAVWIILVDVAIGIGINNARYLVIAIEQIVQLVVVIHFVVSVALALHIAIVGRTTTIQMRNPACCLRDRGFLVFPRLHGSESA